MKGSNKKQHRPLIVAIAASLLAALLAGPANAALLSVSHIFHGGGANEVLDSVHLDVDIVQDGWPVAQLFSLSINADTAGQWFFFEVSESTNAWLTNGQNDRVREEWAYGSGTVTGWRGESGYFLDNRAIDFEGFRVDAFALYVWNSTFDTPGDDPNGDGRWTDYSINATLFVVGSPVPVPGGLPLILSAIVALVHGRRRALRST